MLGNPKQILGPMNDPCLRISDFGECKKSVGIIQDTMVVFFMLGLSYIFVTVIRDLNMKTKIVQKNYIRFWTVASISVVMTLFNSRIIPMFGQPYEVIRDPEYNSTVIEFKEHSYYETAFLMPYYTGYICFYLYDFLFIIITMTVNNVYMMTGKKLAKVFDYILKFFYAIYVVIVLLCVFFSLNFMSNLCGFKWLNFAFNFNFVIHPTILGVFYVVCSFALLFNKDVELLIPKKLHFILKLMILFIMILVFIQTAFSIFTFHLTPNAFAIYSAFNYSERRYGYLNTILSYDFLAFTFPLLCLIVIMFILTKINFDNATSTDEVAQMLEKSLVIDMKL